MHLYSVYYTNILPVICNLRRQSSRNLQFRLVELKTAKFLSEYNCWESAEWMKWTLTKENKFLYALIKL